MEKMNDLKDLLKHEIQDLYSVEEQIIEALPAMIEKAGNKTLKKALSDHLKITQEHKKRLDKIKKSLDLDGNENENKGFLSNLFGGAKHVCKGMQGIIEEGNKIMNEDMTPQVKDAAIIACAQKIEHYEICGYGTARTYASELGLDDVASQLEKSLNEEYQADDLLTALAIQRINIEAGLSETGSGDHSASGSVRNRSGKLTSRTHIKNEEMELEEVSGSQKGERKNAVRSRVNGKPGAAASPRSSTGRESASKRTTSKAASGTTAKSTRSSERGGSGARTGSSGRSRS